MATERRLIDAAALRVQFDDIPPFIGMTGGCVQQFIDKAPTVDAVEVVHGHWEEWYPPMHMILTGEEKLYRCSICDAKYANVEGYRHCPNCGAKMDGERRTDNA